MAAMLVARRDDSRAQTTEAARRPRAADATSGLGRRFCGLVLSLAAAAFTLGVTGPFVSAADAACGGANPHTSAISIAPPNAELPVGANATFQAIAWKAPLNAAAGRKVAFRVVCGPNQGESGTKTTKVHKNTASGTPSAYFSDTDGNGAGTDVIAASTTVSGQTKTATVSVTWEPPVDCGQPLSKLGWLLALQCQLSKAKPLVHTALQMVSCGVGIATFLAPEAKIAKLVQDAKLSDIAGITKDAGARTSLGKFVVDLSRIRKQGIISLKQLRDLLSDSNSLAGFLRSAAALLKTISSHSADVSTLALDIANLTGLGSCVSLLSKIVTFTPPPPPPVAYSLSIFAGIPGQNGTPTGGPATSSDIGKTADVAVDNQGNAYFTDLGNSVVEKISPTGQLSIIAGELGQSGLPVPGPALSSAFDFNGECGGIAVNAADDVFVADCGNNVVEEITPSGQLSIVAGQAGYGGQPTPGPATNSLLNDPSGVAVDAAGNLYISDSGNSVLEKVTPSAQLSIIAGVVGESGSPTPGPATQSLLGSADIAVDSAGNVYLADTDNNLVEKVTTAGQLSIIAGVVGDSGTPTPGLATNSQLDFGKCGQVAVDGSGNVYVADCANSLIEKVTASGQLSIIAGQVGQYGLPTPGPATSSNLANPSGIAVNTAGDVLVVDQGNYVVEELSPGV